MDEKQLIPSNDSEPKQGSIEVQFALVLARTIEAIKDDPEHLRQAVYDLARYKLQEQFNHADVPVIKKTQDALETAIAGVEEFAKNQMDVPLLAHIKGQAQPPLPKPPESDYVGAEQLPPILEARVVASPDPQARASWGILKRSSILLGAVALVALAVHEREQLRSLLFPPATRSASVQEVATTAPAVAQPQQVPDTPPKRNPLLPTEYGIYSISDGALQELRLLPGRAPDIRVGFSAAIKTPSQTNLPNGHPKFIVFRRDLASSASDRAEVRVIAKIAREFTPAAAGKKLDSSDETWVIRNISFPFRSSPMPESPEMYGLHSEDADLELPPGRYALVIKGQAYDFTVDGKVTDPRQCIERVVATNGTFYTDCKRM